MEHILFLVYHLLVQRNRERLARSVSELEGLRRAVPRFDELLADPHARLQQEPVVIGPPDRWSLERLGIAFVLACATSAGLFVIWAIVAAFLQRPVLSAEGALVVFIAFMGTGAAAIASQARGWCELNVAGVVFRHGKQEVFCPWSLFTALGVAHVPRDRSRVIVPICRDARFLVIFSSNGSIVPGQAVPKTAYFELNARQELILRGVYAVDPEELGRLLLHIGGWIGERLPAMVERDVPAPRPAYRGCVAMSLTRLSFPSVCCVCLIPTASVGFVAPANSSNSPPVPVPWCRTCQHALKRLRTKMCVLGGVVGFLFGLGITPVVAAHHPFLNILVPGVILTVLFTGIGGLLGHLVPRDPVHLQLLDKRGILEVRCRNPVFSQLLQAGREDAE